MEEKAPLVLFLPGLDGTGLLFERFLAELDPEVRGLVVAYPRNERLYLEEYAAAVKRVAGSKPVILLAESFSGLVAMKVMIMGGVKVEKVIFVASFVGAPVAYLKSLRWLFPAIANSVAFLPSTLWRVFCLGPLASDSDVKWLKGVLAQVDPGVIAHRLCLLASARAPSVPPLQVPAFYLKASGDRLVSGDASRELGALFQSLTVIEVAGPHFLLQAAPRECARVISGIVHGAPNNSRGRGGPAGSSGRGCRKR